MLTGSSNNISKLRKIDNVIVFVVGATLITLALLALSGCGSKAEAITNDYASPQSVVFVMPNHDKARPANATIYTPYVERAVISHGYVDVIVVDGVPEPIPGGGSVVGSYAEYGPTRDRENSQWLDGIHTLLENSMAEDPEVDAFQAILEAKRSLSTAPDGVKAIVVFDPLVSTTGYLSLMPENAINADPQDYVDYLANLPSGSALPTDFEGIDIYFYQVGDVGGAQESLTPGQKDNLTAVYTAVFENSGATLHFMDVAPSYNPVPEGLPKVTAIDFPDDPAFAPPVQEVVKQPVVFCNSDLRFIGDDWHFVDEELARSVLKPYAQLFRDDPNLTLHITGCTATANSDDKTWVTELSWNRANAVKDILVSYGVNPDRITTEGVGDSLAEWDRDANGIMIPNVAAGNRKVILEFTTVR
jgi:outer membrane protein OmpA-like peptidoglycan-associated protein